MKKCMTLAACIIALSGCASVVSGTHQSLSVTTHPVKGAQCVLENNKGKWYINETPASVTVHRSYNNLLVRCEKDGYAKNELSIKSLTKPAAFGNVLLGGAAGAAIDMANGAAYDYPSEIHIPLRPNAVKSSKKP